VPAEVGRLVVEDLGGPALALGVAQVHAQEVAGEQGGLVTALPRLDLEDDVLAVVRVAGQQQLAQPRLEHLDALLEGDRLRGERRVLGSQLPSGSEVAVNGVELAGGGHDRGQLGEAPAQRPGPPGVGVDGGIGQRLLDLAVLGHQFRQPSYRRVAHVCPSALPRSDMSARAGDMSARGGAADRAGTRNGARPTEVGRAPS
jgi:hypothetical protein